MLSKNRKQSRKRNKKVFVVPPEMRGTLPSSYEPEELYEEDVNEYVVQSSYKGK